MQWISRRARNLFSLSGHGRDCLPRNRTRRYSLRRAKDCKDCQPPYREKATAACEMDYRAFPSGLEHLAQSRDMVRMWIIGFSPRVVSADVEGHSTEGSHPALFRLTCFSIQSAEPVSRAIQPPSQRVGQSSYKHQATRSQAKTDSISSITCTHRPRDKYRRRGARRERPS